MKLASYGKREWKAATYTAVPVVILFIVLAAVFKQNIWFIFAVISGLVWVAFAGFFRDPERVIPEGEEKILSPADGVIKDIELVPASECPVLGPVFDGKDMIRVGIFLSVFDVHINRAPCHIKVALNEHKDGHYYDARDPRAGKENESQVIAGTGSAMGKEFPVAVRQVSGAIARRIVCPVEPGSSIRRGDQYGMIKFGSRTELYLPAGNLFELKVSVGDRVTAGTTIMALMKDGAK